jgi:hypothetical protein
MFGFLRQHFVTWLPTCTNTPSKQHQLRGIELQLVLMAVRKACVKNLFKSAVVAAVMRLRHSPSCRSHCARCCCDGAHMHIPRSTNAASSHSLCASAHWRDASSAAVASAARPLDASARPRMHPAKIWDVTLASLPCGSWPVCLPRGILWFVDGCLCLWRGKLGTLRRYRKLCHTSC